MTDAPEKIYRWDDDGSLEYCPPAYGDAIEYTRSDLATSAAPASDDQVKDAARLILKSYDDRTDVRPFALALAFGQAAYEKASCQESGSVAFMRAMLTALIDPASPDLDYLRARNQPASSAFTPAEEVTRLRNYCGAAHRDLEEMYKTLSDEKIAPFFSRSLAGLKKTSEFMALASEGKEDVTVWGREIVERDEKLAVLSEALETIGGPDEVSLVPLPDPVIRGMLYAQIRVAKDALAAIAGER